MADLKSICIDGDCSTVPSYLAGNGIGITNGVISNTAPGIEYTAGQNVQISNNEISATDTTYSAGTGISIDANNVISATGGGGGSYTAGTNIDITNNVISAPNVYTKTESDSRYVNVTGDTMTGNLTVNRTADGGVIAKSTTCDVRLWANNQNTNHGIYSATKNGWLLRSDGTNTWAGAVDVTSANACKKSLGIKDKYYKLTEVKYSLKNEVLGAGDAAVLLLSPETAIPSGASVVGVHCVNKFNSSSGGASAQKVSTYGWYVDVANRNVTVKVYNTAAGAAKFDLTAVVVYIQVQTTNQYS